MKIKEAAFVISNSDYKLCPTDERAEFAFIGRSNVGKSSLINMLVNNKNLAKTSGRPGKTQLINHYIINNEWFLVNLPGYGYAKASKVKSEKWEKFIAEYLTKREQLLNVFVLLDCRLEPQKIDLEFMNWCGEKQIPFSMVFSLCRQPRSGAAPGRGRARGVRGPFARALGCGHHAPPAGSGP